MIRYKRVPHKKQNGSLPIPAQYFYRFVFCCLILWSSAMHAQVSTPAPQNTLAPAPVDEENLDVFQQWVTWNNPGSLLIHHLINQANDLYAQRDKQIAQLRSKSDWIKRQQWAKKTLSGLIGEFPQRTPLNAQITGTLQRQGYRIEKLIYEGFPGSYVTGCLYIPDRLTAKAPAILNVMGHDQEGYKVELYQVIIANLVKKGMIVLAIDPPGQGEHVQYFDPKKDFSSVGYSVMEHCYFGNHSFIAGVSPAKYFIWEGMRAIDYLLSRKEVDPERIGVTGFSGGGTVTSYIAAIDDRVKVAVPCSWATVSQRQLQTKANQDAETVFIHGLAKGISFEDLLEVRAPKPTLMCFVSRDQYLSLQGAREAYGEAKKIYRSFGKEENLQLCEDDSKHWMTPKIRQAIYAFFMRHFNIPGSSDEERLDILSEKELKALNVTSTGQISTSLGGELIADLNIKAAAKLADRLDQSRKNIPDHLKKINGKARELSGYRAPKTQNEEAFINGRYQRQGYTVGKYAIPGEEGYVIPILLFMPDDETQKHPAIVYVHSEGKAQEAKPGGEIERLVKQGYIVAATDVLGIGETRNTATRPLAAGYNALLIGRSIVGIQAGDIVRTVNYLKTLKHTDTTKIGGIALNDMCLPMLHAAAFQPSLRSITLISPLISYRAVALSRFHNTGVIKRAQGNTHYPSEIEFSWGIANVLSGYDLPDLAASLAPRKLTYIDIRDQALEPASAELIDRELAFPRAAYSFRKAPGNLRALKGPQRIEDVVQWNFE